MLLSSKASDGSLMLSAPVIHQPDQEHGRPEKEKFGDAEIEGGPAQSGYSRQC
jgi:glutamate decarboxylase